MNNRHYLTTSQQNKTFDCLGTVTGGLFIADMSLHITDFVKGVFNKSIDTLWIEKQ